MRYDADHKARTRERVLREAAAAIRADGPDRVGVATIMARAGLTQGGFYAHFTSKDALVAEAIGLMFDEAAESYTQPGQEEDPATVLRRYVNGYVSMRHRNARERGCPVPILTGEVHRLPEAAKNRFNLAVTRMRSRLADLITRAGIDHAEERALDALAEMVGAVALARVVDDGDAEALLAAARRSVMGKLEPRQSEQWNR